MTMCLIMKWQLLRGGPDGEGQPGRRIGDASTASFRGPPVVRFVGGRLERPADLIPLRILEKRLRDQIVLAALPRRDRREHPGGVVRAQEPTLPSIDRSVPVSTPSARTRIPWSSGRGNLTSDGSRVPAAGASSVQSDDVDGFVQRPDPRGTCAGIAALSGSPLASVHDRGDVDAHSAGPRGAVVRSRRFGRMSSFTRPGSKNKV